MSEPMPQMENDGEDMTPVTCEEVEPCKSADYVVPGSMDTAGADGRIPGGSLEDHDGDASVVEGGHVGDKAAEILDVEPCPEAYAGWVDLVERIRTSRTDGMAELYELFSKGIRFYLCRQLGPQELDDKVHDTFVVVVQAIRRGELREPQRLMGFVRTIVRRQVAAHIDKVVHDRRDQQDMESTVRIADPRGNPEDAAIFRQRNELIHKVLHELGTRDREILTRFYLWEQDQGQICVEMHLSETQFRLLKSRAKARFGELGKKKLAGRALQSVCMRTSSGMFH